MGKAVVMRSIEDASGQRCVDIVRLDSELWGWVECRRDPEDAHGWRRIGVLDDGHASEAAAVKAATDTVEWMEGRLA